MKGKKKKFIEAYENALGNVSAACRALGIGRRTFYHWRDTDEEFREAVEDASESNKDFAETMLMKNIREGKESSIIFYLKTRCKDRGYVERIENTGADGAPLVPEKQLSYEELQELLKRLDSE